MDIIDRAQAAEARHLAEHLLNRPVPPPPARGGRCAVCDEVIPPARLATGAGTCIVCQRMIERGEI